MTNEKTAAQVPRAVLVAQLTARLSERVVVEVLRVGEIVGRPVEPWEVMTRLRRDLAEAIARARQDPKFDLLELLLRIEVAQEVVDELWNAAHIEVQVE